MAAAESGHADAVRALLQRGANPSQPAAMQAAGLGKHTAVVRALLQAGASLAGPNSHYLCCIVNMLMKAWKVGRPGRL